MAQKPPKVLGTFFGDPCSGTGLYRAKESIFLSSVWILSGSPRTSFTIIITMVPPKSQAIKMRPKSEPKPILRPFAVQLLFLSEAVLPESKKGSNEAATLKFANEMGTMVATPQKVQLLVLSVLEFSQDLQAVWPVKLLKVPKPQGLHEIGPINCTVPYLVVAVG